MQDTLDRDIESILFYCDGRLEELAASVGICWGDVSERLEVGFVEGQNKYKYGNLVFDKPKFVGSSTKKGKYCFHTEEEFKGKIWYKALAFPLDYREGFRLQVQMGTYASKNLAKRTVTFESEFEMDKLEADGGRTNDLARSEFKVNVVTPEQTEAERKEKADKRFSQVTLVAKVKAEAADNTDEHSYNIKKGIKNKGAMDIARGTVWGKDTLILPMVNILKFVLGDRITQAYQLITETDKKVVGEMKGSCIPLFNGTLADQKGFVVAEGFATAYHAQRNPELNPKGYAAISCMDAQGMDTVVGALVKSGYAIIIAADNDVRPAGKEYIGNTGIEKALSAAFRHKVDKIYVPYNEEGTKTDFADVTTFKVLDVPKKFMDLLLFLRNNNLSSNSNRITNDIVQAVVREIPHKLTVNKAVEMLLQIMPDRTPTTLKEEINKLLNFAKTKAEKNLLKKERLAEVNRDWEAEKGYIIIDTNRTGSGKTEAMVKWSESLDTSIKQIIVTPRVTLVDDVAPKFGAAHYKTAEDSAKVVATTINSLIKFDNLDGCALFVDEFNLCIEHIAIGTVSPRKPCYDKFCETFKNAGVVFIADAFFNEASYQWVEAHANGKEIVFVEHTEGAYAQSDITMWVDTQGYESLADRLMEDLKKGLNIALACDNKGIVSGLIKRAVEEGIIAEEEGLAYTSLTNGEDRQVQWVSDANKYSENLRLLAYSPSISSGVSIKTDHFDKTYLFYDGTVCYDTFLQMARRVRNVTVWCAAFKNINHERMMTNKEMLMEGDKEKNNTLHTYFGDDAELNELGRLRIDVMIDTAEKKQNSAQGFCLAAEMFENVTIEHFEEHDNGGGSGLLKDFVGIHKAEVREKIEIANDISSNRYEELNNKVVNTMEENFEKEKHNVQAMSGKQEVDETDIKRYQQKGMQVVQRFEMLHKDKLEVVAQSGDNLRSQDKMACDAFLYQVVYEMLSIISQAGNRLNGLTIFQLMEVLVKNRKGLSSCGFMDYGTVGGARQAATIQNFLNKFGIKLTKLGRAGAGGCNGCVYKAEEIEWTKQYAVNRGKVTLTGFFV